MSERTIQFDSPMGLFFGGVIRSAPDVSPADAGEQLAHAVLVGLKALELAANEGVNVERRPGAQVEAFHTFDTDTGELLTLWRVHCRKRDERVQ